MKWKPFWITTCQCRVMSSGNPEISFISLLSWKRFKVATISKYLNSYVLFMDNGAKNANLTDFLYKSIYVCTETIATKTEQVNRGQLRKNIKYLWWDWFSILDFCCWLWLARCMPFCGKMPGSSFCICSLASLYLRISISGRASNEGFPKVREDFTIAEKVPTGESTY